MSLRDQNKEEKRTRLLEAARALFRERGYEATTTRELSQRAGVATGTLFLMWLHRVVKVTRALGGDTLRWSPKDAVLGFIIPFINIARPFQVMRDVHDHLARIESAVENLREKTGIAMQVNLAFVTIEESEITKKLAGWAGIFAAATAFAGIWGMNFKYMPELQWEYGYPAALGLISVICYLLYRRFRSAGWL